MRKLKSLWLGILFSVFLVVSAWAGSINLNVAGQEELANLPGVGPKIAAAIVEYREKYGPFKSVDELLEIKGIGPKKLEKIRPLVTIEPVKD
ncbi:competence protein ComEA helix-hairpin-helix repeat protein [Thermodesulfatator indicus DSM 15286]|uniref:Competence protein ComEA helix-hairpin-helix repeat protein n=1 Tax=Thermodesulfatator indicus (strain DSM 15286 / JCM 11887 / CIR29812) TaxID=667014 RepID=F8AC40_THEID|nr:helix-hairpin-helix domain-containing protein [Thermodesulfatator indicus]AEH44595.1 competence protein ComEA helix-hairpin-helix repeat protein [Thermodesulfatator indicus DSM 15286]